MVKSASKHYLIHPVLLSLYFLLFLYSYNIEELPPSVVIKPMLASLVFMAGLFLLFRLLLKDGYKSALLTSCTLFAFYSFGQIEILLRPLDFKLFGLLLGSNKLTVAAVFLFLVLSFYGIIKSKKSLVPITQGLNYIALFLILSTLWTIATYRIRYHQSAAGGENAVPTETADPQNVNRDYPDIYYIILDEYLRGDLLASMYGYDTSSFFDYLRKKNFYIAEKSNSNYAFTLLSVTSSLNMRYVNDIADAMVGKKPSYAPLRKLLDHNQVLKILHSHRYKFIAINSGAWVMRINGADIKIAPSDADFIVQIINTSMLSLEPTMAGYLGRQSLFLTYSNVRHRDNILNAFQTLSDIAKWDSPKFVFAHLLVPHPPFVFGELNKKIVLNTKMGLLSDAPEDIVKEMGMQFQDLYIARYSEQLEYINGKLQETVDAILAQSKKPPIIILQGDHGPRRLFINKDNYTDSLKTDMLKERMSIFNAYHLPDGGIQIPPDITPVNSFRMIFNHYFNMDFKPLENRIYFSTKDDYYHLEDVTHKLRQ